MADWMILLVPLAILAIASLVRFVGCADILDLDSYKEAPDVPPQTNRSRWPLDGTADDVEGGHSGIFVSEAMAENASGQSPPGAGTFDPNADGLLQEAYPGAKSLRVDAGWVHVDFHADLNGAQFTVMGWVQPEWDPNELLSNGLRPYRTVIASRDTFGGVKGFAVMAGPPAGDATGPFHWQLWAGNGDPNWPPAAKVIGPPVDFGTFPIDEAQTTFLAVACDGSEVKLFVGPDSSNQTIYSKLVPGNQGPNGQGYVPNPSKPLYIGTGAPEDYENPQNRNPAFPFKGRLQEFKVYDMALPTDDIVQMGMFEFFGA
jgi:hypothetical protein